nr:hypothetical protein [Hymenobacter frigidus]
MLLLRVSGKRTLTKVNAFDLVVTVALGSTLATVLLTKSVALAEGLTAFVLLIFLQFVLTWLSVRSRAVSRLVKSEPTLLVYQGWFLAAALKAERMTEAEVLMPLQEVTHVHVEGSKLQAGQRRPRPVQVNVRIGHEVNRAHGIGKIKTSRNHER